jgi:hypothetical protein
MAGSSKLEKQSSTAMNPGKNPALTLLFTVIQEIRSLIINFHLTEDVEQYLKANPEFLACFVRKNVSGDVLQQWVESRAAGRRGSTTRWKFAHLNNGHADGGSQAGSDKKCAMLKSLAVQLHRNPTEGNVIWELAVCISSAIAASSFVLYLMDPDTKTLRRFSQLKK